jgi:hypothetical protein
MSRCKERVETPCDIQGGAEAALATPFGVPPGSQPGLVEQRNRWRAAGCGSAARSASVGTRPGDVRSQAAPPCPSHRRLLGSRRLPTRATVTTVLLGASSHSLRHIAVRRATSPLAFRAVSARRSSAAHSCIARASCRVTASSRAWMSTISACPALSSSIAVLLCPHDFGRQRLHLLVQPVCPLPFPHQRPLGLGVGHRQRGFQFVDLRPQRLHHRPFLGAFRACVGRSQGQRRTHGRCRAQRARRRCSRCGDWTCFRGWPCGWLSRYGRGLLLC